jgi:phage shock protein A
MRRMSYFSRLTDIVTCNLSDLLSKSPDPQAAIEQILREMDEGLSGARRTVATATANEERLAREVEEHRIFAATWAEKAKEHLRQHREDDARQALLRKREVEDLLAGLMQQHQSAVATREHLATMHRAIEARYAEAQRKRAALCGDAPVDTPATPTTPVTHAADRLSQVDAELEALKRELEG